jgi:RNA polymerase sigma-70 factor (ECF subfamily)
MSEPIIDSDAVLIAGIRQGDTRRYGTLVERHKNRAYTVALRLLGRPHEAEEAVQDAFIRAYNSLPGFRGDSRFTTWFTRILYNVCMTRISRRRPDGPSLDALPDHEREVLEGAGQDPSPLEQLEASELIAALDAAVTRLPERYRAVVTLFYIQDLAHDQVAQVLDIPLGTVKTHLFRARSMLKTEVERIMKERVVV